MLLVYWTVGWFIGLWLASLFALQPTSWLVLGGAALAGALILRRHTGAALILASVGAAGLGGARYQSTVPAIGDSHVAYYNGVHDVTLTGLVVAEPDVRDRSVDLRLAVDSITFGEETTRPVEGNILVRTFRFPVIQYGTRLQIKGRLETPPDEGDFSYKDHLARQDIHSLIVLPEVTVLGENHGRRFYHAISTFKQRAQATINRLIPEPQAALLNGILLGDDNNLPLTLKQAFRTTGVTHIVAISGFNIAILAVILTSLSQLLLSRRQAVILAMVGIIVYTILVGAAAPVVRAALMGSVYLITTRWLGRPTYVYASLGLAGFLMTLFRPLALWDVGFQLSFAAMLSLALYADPVIEWARSRLLQVMDEGIVERIMGLLTETVIVTTAAQILIQPLMAGYFEEISLISLPANALVLPAQPGVMIWGGLATLVGMVLPAVGQALAWVAWLFLSYTILVVRIFASLPGAVVPVHVSPVAVVAIYAVIAAVTWLARQAPERRARLLAQLGDNVAPRLALATSLLMALLALSWNATQPDGYLHVVFMNVGQGDATLIQTPTGRHFLVDGGYYPSILNDELGRQIPFWDREIDVLVATHPDADHISGLVGVFDRYRVGRLITNGEGIGESPLYDTLLLAAEAASTAIDPALAGQVIEVGDGVRLEILHPGAT